MKSYSRIAACSAALALMTALYGPAASADDDAKLKALERAMTAPGSHDVGGAATGKTGKKIRTRAIVFDNAEPQPAAQEEQKAAAVEAAVAKVNCAELPADAKAEPIDFAIQFRLGSADIAPASEALLMQIAKVLSMSPDRCVIIEGHTDISGNADKNLSLSRDRAAAVVKFVAEKANLDRQRLVPVGKGSSDPMKNLDPRDPKNRRVVFKVVAG